MIHYWIILITIKKVKQIIDNIEFFQAKTEKETKIEIISGKW